MRFFLFRVAPVAMALMVLPVASFAQSPSPNSATLTTCGGLGGSAAQLCVQLDAMNPTANWPATVHVDWRSGRADRSAGGTPRSDLAPDALFAAAAAERLGVYLLRPPRHAAAGLANDQFVWMWNQGVGNQEGNLANGLPPGWSVLGASSDYAVRTRVQALANAGAFVVAAYADPFGNPDCQIRFQRYLTRAQATRSPLSYDLTDRVSQQICPDSARNPAAGTIAIVRPNAVWPNQAGYFTTYGPVVAVAGNNPANATTSSDAFPANAFAAGHVYYFAFNGPPPRYQGFVTGLFSVRGDATASILLERSALGAIAAAYVGYDAGGQAIWYFGDGGLTAGQQWLATPAPDGQSLVSYDDPLFFAMYVQPATGGENLFTVDGGPLAPVAVGPLSTSFYAFDNAAASLRTAIDDSGRISGPTGPIAADAGLTATIGKAGDPALLSRVPYNPASTAQKPPVMPAPAQGTAAGWWWLSAAPTQWAAAASFKPVGLFLDVQGDGVNGVMVGAVPTGAGSGSPVAPYRPSWLKFLGTGASAGSLTGAFSNCTAAGCQPGPQAVLAASADGLTLTTTIGNQTYQFVRYRMAAGNPAFQTVPLDIAIPTSNGTAYLTQRNSYITINGSDRIKVLQDAGSDRLFVSICAVRGFAEIDTATIISGAYTGGTSYKAYQARGYVTYGGITTAQPIYFGAIFDRNGQAISCPENDPPPGTMGVDQPSGTGLLYSALAQLSAPFNTGYLYSVANKSVQIGLTAGTTARFTTIQMASLAAPSGAPPIAFWDRYSIPTVISIVNPANPGQVLATISEGSGFDTGSVNVQIYAPAATNFAAVGAPNGSGRYNVKQGYAVSFTSPLFNKTVTAIDPAVTELCRRVSCLNQIDIGPTLGAGGREVVNTGDTILAYYDLLYDGITGKLGTAAPQ